MKKLLPILVITLTSLLISKEAMSLPNCSGNYWNNCKGVFTFKPDHPNWPGATYTGEWKNGKPDGNGTGMYPNGANYVGQLKNGLAHGYGVFSYDDGGTYVGQWKNDKREGQGTITYADGDKYVGQWKNHKREGQGTQNWPDGSKYVGQFMNNMVHGQGIMTYADGPVNEGIWKDDEFQYANIIPSNAYAFGSSWKCNSGYTKSGNNCIENPVDTQVYSAASGSGFAVTSDGYVITNYHVIKGCTDVYIHDKGESILSTIVTFDPNNDIALLKGNFKPKSFYPLSRESTKLLTEVYVAGHPFGRDISTTVKVTRGIVSSLTGVANNFSNLQIDASLQPGNSGGPIMNDKGNVIGVAVAKLDLDTIVEDYGVVPENVNFGVKANVVINIMESESIPLPKPNLSSMPMSELGEMITDGTYYLSCWMTMAQINKARETKVIFKSFN